MKTRIIIFTCNWSIAPGLHLSEFPEFEKDDRYKIIINMCSGRLDPELLVQAFKNGAWGVMIASCPPEECEHNGNYKPRRRIMILKHVLDDLGVEPERLKLEWIGTGEVQKFKNSIEEFTEKIEKMGPLELNIRTRG